MLEQQNSDDFHKTHAFTLPKLGDIVVSPLTGTAYEIGPSLDSGAHGYVYHCTSEWGDDLVAKVLKPSCTTFAEIETKAVLEITAQALARSPHIVHIHDAFVFKGACYIISEHCFRTLDALLDDEKVSPSIWFPAMARAILHGLHFIHVHGIAHCDIHPKNVFLKRIPDALFPEAHSAFTFKLGDFGQARAVDAMDPQGTFLNSIRPPEAFDPEEFGPLNHRADVYQAGILFLSFLDKTRYVFTQNEILRGIPRQLAEQLPAPFHEPISQMLRRHAEYRTPTAIDVWRQLKPLLHMQ